MASVLITGCAGFIGSHIVESCLARGDDVLGIDMMTDYYDVTQKRSNVELFAGHPRFTFVEADLASGCADFMSGVDVVFHQAGQPGVRSSWRSQFGEYLKQNVAATQAVLDAAHTLNTPRVVYASSSSVYGNAAAYPVNESTLPSPYSPYGVTKLAAEHLCSLYASNFGLSVVSLRYFTVYGPRQRPDMATHRLIEAAISGGTFELYGDGLQVRDFTYVDDVVAANLAAGEEDVPPGLVANIAGGTECSMQRLISTVEEAVGAPIKIDVKLGQYGDVRRTAASAQTARELLGWTPGVRLSDGIEQQVQWHRRRRQAPANQASPE